MCMNVCYLITPVSRPTPAFKTAWLRAASPNRHMAHTKSVTVRGQRPQHPLSTSAEGQASPDHSSNPQHPGCILSCLSPL